MGIISDLTGKTIRTSLQRERSTWSGPGLGLTRKDLVDADEPHIVDSCWLRDISCLYQLSCSLRATNSRMQLDELVYVHQHLVPCPDQQIKSSPHLGLSLGLPPLTKLLGPTRTTLPHFHEPIRGLSSTSVGSRSS